MSAEFCRDCQTLGHRVKAERMVGRTGVCDFHWRARTGQPAKVSSRPPAKEQVMGRHAAKEVNAEEIRKDHAAGMSISAIAEKHGISWPTVKSRLTAKNGNGPTPGRTDGRTDGRTLRSKRGIFNAAGANGYGSMIADLEAKRAKLDAAIAALRELAGE